MPSAVLGTAGIEGEKLRKVFETPDPPQGRTLIPKLPKLREGYPTAFNEDRSWQNYYDGGGGHHHY